MADLYLGEWVIEEDVYLDDDTRLHLNGDDIELQTKIADVWTTQQSWGS